jgi:hypothetical protein
MASSTHWAQWNQQGDYVGKDGQTTNAAENFFGNFKRSVKALAAFAASNICNGI